MSLGNPYAAQVTFRLASRLFLLDAIWLGAFSLRAASPSSIWMVWWQQALVFYGVEGSIGFARTYNVFAFLRK